MKDNFPNFNSDALYQAAGKLVQKRIEEWDEPIIGENAAQDATLADELASYIENESDWYRMWATPIINNLKKHMARGKFDRKLAMKSWARAADAAADMYAKKFGGPGAKGKVMFSKKVRMMAAEMFMDDYEEEIFWDDGD